MKRFLILLVLLPFMSSVYSQKLELYGYGGYTLNSKINTYYGDFNVADNGNYGAVLAYMVGKGSFVELSFNRNETTMNYNRSGIINASYGIAIEEYQLGGLQQLNTEGKLKPYFLVSLGAARFHAKEKFDENGDGNLIDTDDTWAFSGTLALGLKIYLTDRIGLRGQARMLLPMQFSGLMLGIGTGGVSGGAGFTVPMVSGDFTAGVFLAF